MAWYLTMVVEAPKHANILGFYRARGATASVDISVDIEAEAAGRHHHATGFR